ncbi:MAG: hypothetical protein QOE68_1319 [Thermoanaerobaculia bacterium]|nr:hypothetical protein [Thermoanaerobaculia bacterium]
MKTYLGRYNPTVVAAPRWRRMETLLRDSLIELGHEVVEREWDANGDRRGDSGFTILPHSSRRVRPDAHLFFKEMHLPGLFTVDVDGWGVEHSALQRDIDFEGVDADSAVPRLAALRERMVIGNLSRQPQPAAGDVPDSGYILLALQMPADSVVVDHSPISMMALLDAVTGWAEARRQRVAVKLHPCSLNIADLVEAVTRLTRGSRYVVEVRGNIHSLIAAARGVFVINSSTGFEALLHGKPVATFGDCDYKRVTFAATAATIDDAADWCDVYGAAEQLRAAQFVDWYCSRHGYPVLDDDISATQQRLRGYLSEVVPR